MRNVLICGGSRGIGSECVRQFSLLGDKVVFTYKSSEDRARELSDRVGARCLYCDFESEISIRLAAAEARDYFGEGGVDILVN